MTKKKFEKICESTFNSFKEPYIIEKVENIDNTLDSFSRAVYASYANWYYSHYNTDSEPPVDISFEIVIGKYREKLRNYLEKKRSS